MSDPIRYRRGKPGGEYVEKSTMTPVIAWQFVEAGIAFWIVDDLVGDVRIVSSDAFAEQYATPR